MEKQTFTDKERDDLLLSSSRDLKEIRQSLNRSIDNIDENNAYTEGFFSKWIWLMPMTVCTIILSILIFYN